MLHHCFVIACDMFLLSLSFPRSLHDVTPQTLLGPPRRCWAATDDDHDAFEMCFFGTILGGSLGWIFCHSSGFSPKIMAMVQWCWMYRRWLDDLHEPPEIMVILLTKGTVFLVENGHTNCLTMTFCYTSLTITIVSTLSKRFKKWKLHFIFICLTRMFKMKKQTWQLHVLSSSPAVLQGHVLFGLPRARTRPPGETTSGTQTGLKNPMVINGV